MKKIQKEEIEKLLKNAKDGVLAFSGDNTPYCIPFGFVYVDGSVYLSMFPTGRKWQYYQNNNRVCFNVFLWNNNRTEWSSVVIEGELEMVNDINVIEAVVRENLVKTGIDVEKYIEKRMEYYKKAVLNPNALKILKIKAFNTAGRKMPTMIGKNL